MKRLGLDVLGGFLLLVFLVLGLQGSMILSGLVIGAAVGLALLIALGPERLGIALLLVATFLSPMNGLKLGEGGNVTFADFGYVLAIGLLIPRLLQSTSKLPRLYVWGVSILVVNALVVSALSAIAIPSLLGFVRVAYAMIVIPIVFHRLRPSFTLLNAFAWAYVGGQLVSMFRGLATGTVTSEGRAVGWTTQPNFYALGGQLAFALCAFLFYRTPKDKRWIVVLVAILCAYSVYESGSRASLLCIVTTVLLWPIVERTAISTYVLVSVGAVGAIIATYAIANAPAGSALARLRGEGSAQGSDLQREISLQSGIDRFLANPIQGNGWTNILDIHNVYVEVLVAGGVIALLGFLFVMASMLRPLFAEPVPNRLAFVTASYLVFAALGPTIYDRVLWGALGLVFALHPEDPNDSSPEEVRLRRTEKKLAREARALAAQTSAQKTMRFVR